VECRSRRHAHPSPARRPNFRNQGRPRSLHDPHGGSGTDEEDLRKAIAAGMNIVHISTELRLAWRRGIEAAVASQPDEVAPYKILPSAVEAVQGVVQERLQLFRSAQFSNARSQSRANTASLGFVM